MSPAVAAGLLPAILFGGVLGAGIGSCILYAGAMEEDPSIENIFAEAEEVAAHSVKEERSIRAASVREARKPIFVGLAAKYA